MLFEVSATKLQSDTVSVSFDFASMLAIGETLASAVCTAEVFSGEDASPELIIDGSTSLNGTVVLQKITDGVVGVVYVVNCTATTSAAQELTIQTYIAIVSTNPFQ